MKRFDQINVIPFIDIMLVLLAIVLTTATFIGQGRLDINLPKASKSQPPPDQADLIQVGIDKNEVLFYNQQAVSLDEFEARISSLSKDTGIVIRIDETVPFQRFISALDVLKRQQMERISIVTKQQQ